MTSSDNLNYRNLNLNLNSISEICQHTDEDRNMHLLQCTSSNLKTSLVKKAGQILVWFFKCESLYNIEKGYTSTLH